MVRIFFTYLTCQCEFMASEKMGSAIIVILTTHHQPPLTSCNGTLWNNKGNLLTVNGEDRIFSASHNECGVCFSSMYPGKVPLH